MNTQTPPSVLLNVTTLAAISPADLVAEITELRRVAAEAGLDVRFAVDVTNPSDMATLKWIRRVWPKADPATAKPKRPRGRPKRSKESVLESAEAAVNNGVKWREFVCRQHPRRTLTPEEVVALKARFGGPV
jgi:hypothetical protein